MVQAVNVSTVVPLTNNTVNLYVGGRYSALNATILPDYSAFAPPALPVNQLRYSIQQADQASARRPACLLLKQAGSALRGSILSIHPDCTASPCSYKEGWLDRLHADFTRPLLPAASISPKLQLSAILPCKE